MHVLDVSFCKKHAELALLTDVQTGKRQKWRDDSFKGFTRCENFLLFSFFFTAVFIFFRNV